MNSFAQQSYIGGEMIGLVFKGKVKWRLERRHQWTSQKGPLLVEFSS